MDKLRVIIADDEIDACEGLQLLLSREPDISVISVGRSGTEAVRSIKLLKPDLVFLDIQMPGLNGFEVLEALTPKDLPAFIFVTAYDEYALHAFEVHALDYLQKPFTDERFAHALSHARERLLKQESPALLPLLAEEIAEPRVESRLKIKSSGKLNFLDYKEVYWIEGFDYYIKVHTESQFYLVRESLKKILTRLPEQFVQVHKSSIVNTEHLRSLEPRVRGSYEITLTSGHRLILSRSYKQQFKGLL